MQEAKKVQYGKCSGEPLAGGGGGDAQKLLCLWKEKALSAAYVGVFLRSPFSPKKLPGSRSSGEAAAARPGQRQQQQIMVAAQRWERQRQT